MSSEAGIYNISEDDGTVTIDKARAALGWNADFRVGAYNRQADTSADP